MRTPPGPMSRCSDANAAGISSTTYAVFLLLMWTSMSCAVAGQDPWKETDAILKRITVPEFSHATYTVTEFGARSDGTTDCTEAFVKAIAACANNGGGMVVVPPGTFLTGPIHLRSNVNLRVQEGATIRFFRDPAKYLPLVFTRWEGVECMNYSPLIYAFGQENIAVTGKGTLDGQASDEYWWPWKGSEDHGWKEGLPDQRAGRKKLFAMGEEGVPVQERRFGEGFFLRPSFIQPYKCRNILIEGVSIVNSPMWEIHPVLSQNITVRDVHIDTHGPNNDGCNPESCTDVLIEDSFFDTGDDCIAIKAGRNNDGRRVNTPSQNIVIRRCTFKDGHGGVTIGSEMSGGVRNVFAEGCEFESPVLYSALRIKTNAVRGGTVENIYLRDMHVRLVGRAAVDIDLFYEEGRNGSFLPTVRNITIERMIVEKCRKAFTLVGYPDAPLQNIRFVDCDFREVAEGYTLDHVNGLECVRTRMNGKELAP
jgi:polygalacturonase